MSEQMSKFWRAVLLFGRGMEKEETRAALTQFVSELHPFFQERGFSYKQVHEAFARKEADITWTFSLGLSSYPDAFAIRPMASVRHEQVEQLFHRVSRSSETVQRCSATVLWHRALERRNPKPNSFTVDRSSKVTAGVKFGERFFNKWVEPFFRENSDLIAIDKGFNDNRAVLRSKFVHDWFEVLGRAIIAAKLAGRPDYTALTHEYRKRLRDHRSLNPDPVKAFDALTQRLEQPL